MAIDWTRSMAQTFEFWKVDPGTWKDTNQLFNIVSCDISRDLSIETKASASLECIGDVTECYVRIYITPSQDGIDYKFPLGTFIIQTPNEQFNGKYKSYSMDAYSPLIELKEKYPPLGYTAPKGANIIDLAKELVRENCRAPLIEPADKDKTLDEDFIANVDDTWLTFISDLIAKVDMSFDINELGEILFSPAQQTEAMQPAWTYDDSNSSILLPDITIEKDLYGIPNVLEVFYSGETKHLYSRVENNEEDSPISITNRGRIIMQRDTSPSISGNPNQDMLDEYAQRQLMALSTLQYSVSYTHGFTPIRVNDCVRLDYTRADLANTKVRIVSQIIKCDTGCTVQETAVYTNKFYRADAL